jgi:putative Holliday junction resolvase
MKVIRVDGFTSKMAFQSMIDSGMNKKATQTRLIDEISATIMLQDYLTGKRLNYSLFRIIS